MRADEKNKPKKHSRKKYFLSLEMNLFFTNFFFPKIGNIYLMRALGRKKTMVFFGNARPKSNARAYLKQRKKNIVA